MSRQIVPVLVGLDYHRSSVQVCVLDEQGKVLANRRCPNDVAAVAGVITRHGQPERLALESCTGAADFAQRLVDEFQWDVRLAHPGYVNRMKNSVDKTDAGDARLLADLVRVRYLPEVWLAPTSIRDLRTVMHLRQRVARDRRVTKQQVAALLRDRRVQEPEGGRWTRSWRTWIMTTDAVTESVRYVIDDLLEHLQTVEARLARIERRLKEMTKDDRVVKALLALPRIGPITAWMLRATVGRFDRFRNAKQFARFIGVTPRNASSGERMADAGIVKAGNRELKGVVVQAAHRIKRHHERWATLFNRLVSKGKPKNVATVAVANRWMRSVYVQMKDLH